jgi:FAD/FMN-containing dehydrogenase
LGAALEEGIIADALIAQSEKERESFWAVREGAPLDRLPSLVNFDVSLAIGILDEFAAACEAELLARFPGAHVSFFGHVGDSNLHIAVSVGDGSDETLHEIDAITYGLVRKFGGSVSAEHGIGTLKRDYLGYSRSAAELEVMRRIKSALDPKGILNPGKVIPPG